MFCLPSGPNRKDVCRFRRVSVDPTVSLGSETTSQSALPDRRLGSPTVGSEKARYFLAAKPTPV